VSGGLLDGIHHVPWAPGLYLGPLVLLCAGVAVLGRRDRMSLTLGGLGLLALGLAAGQHLPLYKLAYNFVPGVKFFRYTEKYALVPTFALASWPAVGLGLSRSAPGCASACAGLAQPGRAVRRAGGCGVGPAGKRWLP